MSGEGRATRHGMLVGTVGAAGDRTRALAETLTLPADDLGADDLTADLRG